MKRTTVTISLILFALSVFTTPPAMAQERTEERDAEDFSGVSLGVSGSVYVSQGAEYKVVLNGDADHLDRIETIVRGDILRIRDERKWSWNNWNQKITAWVTLPEIEYLAVSGSGKMEAETAIETDRLEIHVSGSGRAVIDNLRAGRLETSISGSGNVYLGRGGSTRTLDIRISGSGNLHAEDFKVEEADISISGSGDCEVFVTESLDARISGSGSVYYRGNPRYMDSKVSGSGKIRKGR